MNQSLGKAGDRRQCIELPILLMLVWTSGLYAAGGAATDFEKLVKNLASGTPQETVDKSVESLKDAKLDAFATLVAHLNDNHPAAASFQGDKVDEKTGQPVKPTLGDACFVILQTQIEGTTPKSLRRFQVLTKDNVKQWLADRDGKSIGELRTAARAQSLQLAHLELRKNPKARRAKVAVQYYMKSYDQTERELREAAQSAAQ